MQNNDTISQSPEASTSSDDSKTTISPSPLLPPCRICGSRASGFHYGANTCEACKGFFRRSLARRTEYKCVQGDGLCVIGAEKRSGCSHCRLQKCLSHGMSKAAIKTGRYTHEKKTSDICEVKRLRRGNIVIERTDEQLEAVLKEILDAHKVHTPHTEEFFEKVPLMQKEFLEKRDIQQHTFGTVVSLTKDEYMQIYKATGIDVDGRQEKLQEMIPPLQEAVKRFIKFAKALPGFTKLPMDDQVALIKVGRVDAWVVWHNSAFNLEDQLVTLPWGNTWDFNYLKIITQDDRLYDLRLNIIHRLKRLKLTHQETVVLGCICFMCPDRYDLQSPSIAEESQMLLVEVLIYLLRRSHPIRPMAAFAQISNIMSDIRTMQVLQQDSSANLRMDWEDKIHFPALFYEIWTT